VTAAALARLPPDVGAFVQRVLSSARAILGQRLVGMYLDGSLATGDFDPAKSDIDFVVVTDGALTDGAVRDLHAMHARIAVNEPPWGMELEGSYIPRAALKGHDPRPAAHPYIDRGTGNLEVVRPESGYWVIHRSILRDHGLALAGPDPTTLIDPVKPDQLREAVRGVLREWWAPMLADSGRLRNEFYRCYAVLTMCRMLYTLRHGSVVSKPVAAAWAREALERRWHPLIDAALAWSRGNTPDPSDTLDFIRFVSTGDDRVHRTG
jgi:hypothetical protein